MTLRESVDARGAGVMLLLCLAWSLQQIVLKATSADMAPILQIAVRSGIAAILVWLLMRWRGEQMDLRDGSLGPGLLCGLLFALEFLLAGEGLRHTKASHLIVFLYTAPIFAALGLHWKLPSERLAPLQWIGIGIAFGGIALAFLGGNTPADRDNTALSAAGMLRGDLLGLLAGAFWGATTVVIRTTCLANLPVAKTLLYQLASGFAVLMLAAIALGHTRFMLTAPLIAGLGFQSVIVSFVSFLAWFWLLRRYLAYQLGVFSFVTPFFGVLLGVWLLDEPLEAGFVSGAALVMTGIVMVSGYGWLRLRLRTP